MKILNHNYTLFLGRLVNRFYSLCVAYPERPLTFLAGVFYLYQLAHLPLLWAILFTQIAALATFGLIYVMSRWLRRRLARENPAPGVELAIAGVLLLGLYLFDLVWREWWLLLLPLVYFAWLLSAALLRRTGLFYAGLIALLFFVLAVGAHRLLLAQQWLYAYGNHALQISRSRVAAAAAGARTGWQSDGDKRRLMRDGQLVLELEVPPGSFFHAGQSAEFIYGVPVPGAPIAYLSADESDPVRMPAMAIFASDRLRGDVSGALIAADSGDEPAGQLSAEAVAALRESIEQALGFRERSGEIDNLDYAGPITLPDYLQLPERVQAAPGIAYRFMDRVLDEPAWLRIYLTQDRRYLVAVFDAPRDGALFEPAVLRMLRGIVLPAGLESPAP